MSEVAVEVMAEVKPTEDPEKVMTAIKRMFGDLELEVTEEKDRKFVVGKSDGIGVLETFHDLLRRELILDAARRVMFKGQEGKTITFYLNKQVAFVGHVSFSQREKESPLGPIEVKIHCEDPRKLIEWLTPKTA
ncbi:MAG: RNA-binding domain-containing protein [Candidatus Bathyarchaeia archaeon]